MLTDRGRWILAFGGLTYLVAWGFGSEPLYPVAVGPRARGRGCRPLGATPPKADDAPPVAGPW